MTEFSSDFAQRRASPASAIRKLLSDHCVLGVRMVGHPGVGKTELIEATLRRLPAPRRVGVIVVNPAAARDAERLRRFCGFVAHIDAAVPLAANILPILLSLSLDEFDTILIEAAGGLGPFEDLGQDSTVAVFAASGGDDKAAEYHGLLSASSVVVLTKIDLAHLVKFNVDVFRSDVVRFNPAVEVHELSAITGSGLSGWIGRLEGMRRAKSRRQAEGAEDVCAADSFFG